MVVTLILETMSKDGTHRPVTLGKKDVEEAPKVGEKFNGRTVISVHTERMFRGKMEQAPEGCVWVHLY